LCWIFPLWNVSFLSVRLVPEVSVTFIAYDLSRLNYDLSRLNCIVFHIYCFSLRVFAHTIILAFTYIWYWAVKFISHRVFQADQEAFLQTVLRTQVFGVLQKTCVVSLNGLTYFYSKLSEYAVRNWHFDGMLHPFYSIDMSMRGPPFSTKQNVNVLRQFLFLI
jgi:hypothetical protein